MIYTIFNSDGALKKIVDIPPNNINLQLEEGDTYVEGSTNYLSTTQDHLGKVISMRSMLLQQSDWTQLPDVPLETKEAWAVYRQALRDITDQVGFPEQIEWPTAPT